MPRRTSLAQLRIRRGLSQERLAARAGLSSRTVGNLERGIGRPRALTLEALSQALECEPAEILPVNESRPPAQATSTKTSVMGARHEGYPDE